VIEIRDPQLPDEGLQHRIGHRQRVFEKGAEKAGGGKLQGKAQPIVIATLGIDSGVVSIVQMEKARQLLGARIARVPTVMGALFGSEEVDGHRVIGGSIA
jgi:hypothetical protein